MTINDNDNCNVMMIMLCNLIFYRTNRRLLYRFQFVIIFFFRSKLKSMEKMESFVNYEFYLFIHRISCIEFEQNLNLNKTDS